CDSAELSIKDEPARALARGKKIAAIDVLMAVYSCANAKPEIHCFAISSSTSAAWPLAFTFSHTWRIFASGPIQYDMRTIPRNDLPRKLFMRRAPYTSIVSKLVSASSGKFKLYFALNF